MNYRVFYSPLSYIRNNKFTVTIQDCSVIELISEDGGPVNDQDANSDDNFVQDKYEGQKWYYIKLPLAGCDTICGCATFSTMSDLVGDTSQTIVTPINAANKVNIDLSSYATSAFETTITITYSATNSYGGSLTGTFTVLVFDCMLETQTVPTSDDLYALVGNSYT